MRYWCVHSEQSADKERQVTNIRIIGDTEAVGEVAKVYEEWRALRERTIVPNILKCFSARPEFLRQVIALSDTVHFSDGHLTRRVKEAIACYVSALNQCPY